MTKKGKKTEFQMYESRMAKLEHKLKMAEEARKKKKEKRGGKDEEAYYLYFWRSNRSG